MQLKDSPKNTTFGISVLMLSQGVFIVLSFLLHIILARHYGPKDYGLYGFVISILTWVELTINSGVPAAIPKLINQTTDSYDALVIQGLKLNTMFSATITFLFVILVWLSKEVLGNSRVGRLLIISSPDILLYSAYAFFGAILSGKKAFLLQGIAIIIYISSKFLIFTLVVLSHMSLFWIFIGNWVASGIGCIYLWQIVRPKLKTWRTAFKNVELLRLSSYTIVYWLSFYLLINMDLWVVKALLQDEDLVGCYVAASTVGKIPIYFFTIVNGVGLPVLSERFKKKDWEGVAIYTKKMLNVSLMLVGLVTLLISSNADIFIPLFFGGSYLLASRPLSILIWGIFFVGLYSFLAIVLIAANREGYVVWQSLSIVSSALIILYFLVGELSVVGAATSILCIGMGGVLVNGFFLRTITVVKEIFVPICKLLIASGTGFCLFAALPDAWFSSVIVYRGVANMLLIGGFVTVCVLFKLLRLKDIILIKNTIPGVQKVRHGV